MVWPNIIDVPKNLYGLKLRSMCPKCLFIQDVITSNPKQCESCCELFATVPVPSNNGSGYGHDDSVIRRADMLNTHSIDPAERERMGIYRISQKTFPVVYDLRNWKSREGCHSTDLGAPLVLEVESTPYDARDHIHYVIYNIYRLYMETRLYHGTTIKNAKRMMYCGFRPAKTHCDKTNGFFAVEHGLRYGGIDKEPAVSHAHGGALVDIRYDGLVAKTSLTCNGTAIRQLLTSMIGCCRALEYQELGRSIVWAESATVFPMSWRPIH
ncbi:hypothetical protein [Acidithiobacillus sp.]|uniref:hypothetical protein n=1 Tax=Acidithiobacillus sp. TaxID=1872118 RepID=UPI0025C30A70|nr:hypothetical protein [Acidithiobacillus sp.]